MSSPPRSEESRVAKAWFVKMTGDGDSSGSDKKLVHFNPASLEYSLTNSNPNKGSGDKVKQVTSQSTAKLSMELVFDTTDTGHDVRSETHWFANTMRQENGVTQRLKFHWGVYEFEGTLDSFKEKIDFFSSEGVPLRSHLNVGLSGKDVVFDDSAASPLDRAASQKPEFASLTASPGRGVAEAAGRAGDARAARRVAEANGVESIRFPGAGELLIDAEVPLTPASAFSSAAAALVGGLDVPRPRALDPGRALESAPAGLATESGARFGASGQVSATGPASLAADVGAGTSLRARIRFEEG